MRAHRDRLVAERNRLLPATIPEHKTDWSQGPRWVIHRVFINACKRWHHFAFLPIKVVGLVLIPMHYAVHFRFVVIPSLWNAR